MRRTFDIIAALGLINLLVLVMCAGWLRVSDRLDRERILEIRELLSRTVTEDRLRREERDREREREEAEREARLRDELLPPPSDVRLELVRDANAVAAQAESRLRDQVAHLRRELLEGLNRLQRDRDLLDAERRAWRASIEAEQSRRGDEQFAKAVRQLELLPARNARDILLTLAATPEGMETAVAYLDAMAPRSGARILRELKDEEQTIVATNLLEALRTFGLPRTGTESPHAQQPSEFPAN